MKLSSLMEGLAIMSQQGDPDITHVTHDSRDVRPGSLFVAIPGHDEDGHAFIEDAVARGAVAVLCERAVDADIPQAVVAEARSAMAHAAAVLYRQPAKELTMVGITGTKGKTTISHMLYETALLAGKTPGLIGTNGVMYKDIRFDITHTTPEASDLQRILRDMADAGVSTVFMEVSSGGLKLDRVCGIDFDLGIFTNLAEDHLGPSEHADEEEYAYWKSTLFSQCRRALINRDDACADKMAGRAGVDTWYGTGGDYSAENIVYGSALKEPTRFQFSGGESFAVTLAAPGAFSVLNALAVLGASEQLGYPKEAPLAVLAKANVAGRAELLPAPEGIQIVLDYAHNGLSLQSMLTTVRAYKPNRLFVLIGTVGGRTKNRRKELGDAAAGAADVVMLTADNPDFEDPFEIIEDMAASFRGTEVIVYKEPDRKAAVETMLALLEPGDILLLAGKGHEEFQLIKGQQIPYSDKSTVRRYYEKKGVRLH